MLGSIDYLVIGHVTRDLLPGNAHTVGGTVSYAGLTAAALHRSVGILTSAHPDFDLAVYDGKATVARIAADETTTFRNTYVNGGRRQVVYGMALPLTANHIPDAWSAPAIAHVGPIMAECDPSLVTSFPDATFVGVTPQGWMRTLNGDGEVLLRSWQVPDLLLERASAVVCSIEDIQGNWELAAHYASKTRVLVITTGEHGGALYFGGRRELFPALCVPSVDPTGAGDVFSAVFFDALVSGMPPRYAAHRAACLASRSVTRIGLDAVPKPDELVACREKTPRDD